jgi:hypothetical protein
VKRKRGGSGRNPRSEIGAVEWITPFSLSFPVLALSVILLWVYYSNPGFLSLVKLSPTLFPHVRLWKFLAFVFQIKCLLFAAWLAVVGAGLGFAALGKADIEFKSRQEAFVFSLGLGWGMLGLGMLVLGLLKCWYPAWIFAGMGLTTPLAVRFCLRLAKTDFPITPSLGGIDAAFASAVAILVLLNLPGTFLPETFYDALVYHLSLPALYWRSHGVVATPHNLYSGVPMLAQMIFGLPVAGGCEEAVHVLNWMLALSLCLGLTAFSLRLTGRKTAGALAGLIFYSTTLLAVLSWRSSVEIWWTFFQFLSVYALAARFDAGRRDLKWTMLAGIFGGLAMGTKYNAWPGVIMLSAVFAWFSRQEGDSPRGVLRELAVFFAMVFVAVGLWPLKNAFFYGNPIYPFWHEIFHSRTSAPDWRGLLADGGSRSLLPILTTWPGLRSFIVHPWSELAMGMGDVESIGLFPLLTLPLILSVKSRLRPYSVVRACLFLFWAVWSLSSTHQRFFLPELPLLALLAGLATESLFTGFLKYAAYAIFLIPVGFNMLYARDWYTTYEADPVVFGTESKADYLSRPHHSYFLPSYPALKFINENLSPDAKILLIGEARSFYCKRASFTATVFDKHPFAQWLEESETPRGLFMRLKENGVSHLMINSAQFLSFDNGKIRLLDIGRKKRLCDDFLAHYLRKVYENNIPEDGGRSSPISVYALVDPLPKTAD